MMRVSGLVRALCSEAASVAGTSRATTSTQQSVHIPKAIKRSPTALLEALSETVGVDTTAPHFAFIDDPATIPTTQQARKNYYLARELGRRAARQLAAEWPTLFMYDRDEPRLEAFRPKAIPDPLQMEANEENLSELINMKEVVNAVKLYERIRAENIEVSSELQMELFRLVVYYNGDDVPSTEIEEWHGWRHFAPQANQAPKWQQAGLADLLYETLDKSEEVSSLMIAGLCKYPSDDSVDRAISIYNEMLGKKQIPSVEAFNGLIRTARSFKEAKVYLKQMVVLRVKPTIAIFNSLLEKVVEDERMQKQQPSQASMILREAIAAQCEPSLRTFSLILKSVEGDEKPEKELALAYLEQILSQLETRKSIEVIERGDQYFFVDAMSLATSANNRRIADRIEALYQNGKNNAHLPAFTDESLFYSQYLMLLIRHLPIEELDSRYRALVPRIVGVTRALTMAMIRKLQITPKWSLLRRVIEDGIAARHMTDMRISSQMRSILLSLKLQDLSVEEREECADLIRRMVDIWIEYSNFTTTPSALRLQQKLTPSAISECSMLLIKIGDRERGWDLLKMLLNEEARSGETPTVTEFGYPQPAIMRALMDEALQNGDWFNASNCLNIIAMYSPQTRLEPIVEQIEQRCKLTTLQKRILNNFVRLRQ